MVATARAAGLMTQQDWAEFRSTINRIETNREALQRQVRARNPHAVNLQHAYLAWKEKRTDAAVRSRLMAAARAYAAQEELGA